MFDAVSVSFKIFDLFSDGYIRREELERLLKAVCENNPYINLTEKQIKDVVSRTFQEADTTGEESLLIDELFPFNSLIDVAYS